MTTAGEDPFLKGQRIDRYEIRELIGQGGMGAVYRAIDLKLGRTIALKTVVAHRRGDKMTEEVRERFMREALAASRVDHRNVVHVFDFGFAEDGTPYIVMEYLRGRSLSAILKSAKEPLAIDYVADVMLSVCAALRACHHVGIIHRDLKPANIFLCDTDTGWEVKVLDFGISKAPATDALTLDGQIIGTPQYLSPEQIEGTVSAESDQYALGVLMYVSLTGRLPYASFQSTRLLRAITEGTFDPPRTLRPDLPEELEAIVLRAMHVSPTQRFESIHALGQKLWKFASERGQTQWKTFYFHTPTDPQPARPVTSTIESRRPPPNDGPRTIDSTASLAPSGALAGAEPTQATVGRSHFAATKTAAASDVGEPTSLSHSDIAGESALSAARGGDNAAGARRATRWRVALVAAAVVFVGVIAAQRLWHRSRVTAPMSPMTTGRPVPPPSPPPAAPAPVVLPPPPPASAAPPRPPEPAADRAAPPPRADVARKKHATRRHKAPKLDQRGIGIPNE